MNKLIISPIYFKEVTVMLQLHTDHYFHIGSAHLTSGKPCQDYAVSGVQDNVALAIVSDGCSTGRHTDVGSRILTLSTATAIREHWLTKRNACDKTVPQEISLCQNIVLFGIKQTLGLNTNDMLATCLYAYVSPIGGFIHIQGDGVIALKYRDGNILMSRFEWQNNTPYYPAYHSEDLENFIKDHGDDLNANCLIRENCTQETDSNFSESNVEEYTLRQGIQGININLSSDLLFNDVEFIAIFSDGITQIDKTDWKDAVSKFMAFKNTTGEFVKRRIIRGIKDVQKFGKGPIDDVSCAIIRVEQINKEEDQDAKD
ncbi:protein phosphatase 2C domain-containing protein [Patescibacteria group bacterium]